MTENELPPFPEAFFHTPKYTKNAAVLLAHTLVYHHLGVKHVLEELTEHEAAGVLQYVLVIARDVIKGIYSAAQEMGVEMNPETTNAALRHLATVAALREMQLENGEAA